MTHPKGYVDLQYLQLLAEQMTPAKRRTYEAMHIQPGHHVLDVGCGPGTDTIPLASLVGPSGKVVGVDYDPAMVAEADHRAEQAGVSAWVEHTQADATALPFEDNTFDSCRSERLFQHLHHPEKALAEMYRVTKSGGRIMVLDTDHSSISIDTEEVDIERRLLRVHTERCLHNGYSGRQLYRLFRKQGLDDIAAELFPFYSNDYAAIRYMTLMDDAEREAVASGVITEEELGRWHASMERAAAEGVVFGSVNIMLASGRKP